MVKEGAYKVKELLDSGILYNNAEVRVLNKEGSIIFSGMAWEMDDDILMLNLKHILSVYPTETNDIGKVWIEVYDEHPMIRPDMCEKFDPAKCKRCTPGHMGCWKQRHKSSHGGFVHEEVNIDFEGAVWSPATSQEVKDTFSK